jgi:shikimate dehydrogenase
MGVPYAEVIGDPIAQSRSPLIHKFWLEKLGLDGDYRATRVEEGNLPQYLSERRLDPDWRGCNVTMPLKRAVLPYLSRLAPDADLAGAVNTILVDADGGLKGFNSDILAVTALLGKLEPPSYPRHVATYVQIVGAGGAARAALIGAARAGYCDFDFFNRTTTKAREMARLLDLPADAYGHPLEALGPIRNPDDGPGNQRYSHVLINASSMGMEGVRELPVDLSVYYPDTVVFDMVAHPVETGLVGQARRLGLRTIDGLQMLVAQAADAFALFFGAAPPRESDGELTELLLR